MNLKAAIAASALLHAALLGYAHTVEAPEGLRPVPAVFRAMATVSVKKVRVEEPAPFGSSAPALGLPDAPTKPEPEPKPTPNPEPAPKENPAPERESPPEPAPKPQPAPKAEPQPEPTPMIKAPKIKPITAAPAEESPQAPVDAAANAATDTAAASTTSASSSQGEVGASGQASAKGAAATEGTSEASRGARGGSGVDQRKLNQQYGLILHGRINAAKSYPGFARKAGIEGRLLLAITVDRTGKIIDVEIRESSGHEILDENALETVRALRRFPLPPSGLTWTQKTFVLPMSYRLR